MHCLLHVLTYFLLGISLSDEVVIEKLLAVLNIVNQISNTGK